MAFYKDLPEKRKKKDPDEFGSWDEEGTHYTKTESRFSREKDNAAGSDARIGERRKQGNRFSKVDPRQGRESVSKISRDLNRKKDFSKPVSKEEAFSGNRRKDRPVQNWEKRDDPKRSSPDRRSLKKYPSDGRTVSYDVPDRNDLPAQRFSQSTLINPELVPDEMILPEEYILCGRNPIREALKNGREIEKLLVQKGELSSSAHEIIREARERKIIVQEADKHRLDEISLHHQGLIAFTTPYKYVEPDEILKAAKDKGEDPFLIILDGITDPHNLGAVIRTAECAGAHGVIIPAHRSVGLTPSAIKASAGAVEHIRIAKVTNLNRTIDELKQAGVWTYAVTMRGEDYEKVDFRGGVALVIGAEGDGISRLTEEKCDQAVSLPMKGKIDSLNASVAAGIIMYRVLACRRKTNK